MAKDISPKGKPSSKTEGRGKLKASMEIPPEKPKTKPSEKK